MKWFQRIVFFAHADELDRLSGHLANGERGPAASVAIHLCKHNAGERELLMELVGRADGILSSHGISHEQNLLRIEQALERLHFVHQLIVDMQAPGSIHDEHI